MIKYLKVALFCFIAVAFLYGPIVNAATFVLEEGKSIEITNNTTSSYSVINTSKIDYASYSITGTAAIIEKDYSLNISVPANNRMVITNAGLTSVTLASASTSFSPVFTTSPALIKGTMLAGKNYEFNSLYSGSVIIRNDSSVTNLYDFVNYNNDGTITAATGIGRNSSATSTTIPIKGKTVISVQSGDLSYWIAYEIYNNYITMIDRQAPALIKGLFEVGKNYQLVSSYNKAISISNDSAITDVYDVASYSNDGTAVYTANSIAANFSLAVKGTTIVTPISGNINYWYPSDVYGYYIIVTQTQNPALFKGIIQMGTSTEFASSYVKTINITNNSPANTLYDYSSYSSDGTVVFKRKTYLTTITVPVIGTTVVTAISGDINYSIPYEFYEDYITATITQTPALYVGILSQGKNYEFKSSYFNDIILVNDSRIDALYDYVTYSKENSSVFTCDSKNQETTIKSSGKTDVSSLSGDICFWYPYKIYTTYVTFTQTETPALVKGIIGAGKNVEFISSCFSDIKIFNNGSASLLYDYANYNSSGTMSEKTFISEAVANNVTIPTKGKTVITALTSSLAYYYPYDLYNPYITVRETQNPALFKGTIKTGKNFEFKSIYNKEIILRTDSRSAALIDVSNYLHDNSVLFEHNSTNTISSIYQNGRTVISSLTGDIKFWSPYEIFTAYVSITEKAEPALFVGIMKANKNYEFTNTYISKVDIENDSNSASYNDYAIYSNDDTCNFERNTTKATTVQFNGRTVVSSFHGDINYWYPYDIFKKYVTVVEKGTPALSRCKLSQGKKYEFTNATQNSIVIKNDAATGSSIVFDYIKYNRDGAIVKSEYNTVGTPAGSLVLAVGERVVVTCNKYSTREIEFYAAYGTITNNGIFPNGNTLVIYSEGFVIQNVTSQLTSLYSVKATTNITNNSDLKNSATVIIALYDSEQKLLLSYMVDRQFAANQMLKIEHEFVREELINGYSIKVFLWEDAASALPLCKSKADFSS